MPLSDVAWAIQDMNDRAPHLALCRNYYEGRHRPVLPDGKTLNRLLRDLLEDLTDNLCDDVVNEPTDRLTIAGWDAPNRPELAQAAAELWEENRGDARSPKVHRDMWMAGDGFAIVQENAQGRPRMFVQQPEQLAVRYSTDQPDTIECAAKAWKAGSRWRINVYLADPNHPEGPAVLERYASKGTSPTGGLPTVKAFQLVTEDEGYGAPTEELPAFPVHHFPADEVGRYGRSALTPVIPLQDVLNKSVGDMVVTMEDTALPQRWATGVQVEYDPQTGLEVNPFTGPGGKAKVWRSASEKVQFGQFAQAQLGGFLEVQAQWRAEIGRKGYLPAHSVNPTTALPPSGVALLVADGRQVKRVKNAQALVGQPWRELMAQMLTMAGHACTAADLEIIWGPAETRDEQALVDTLTAKVALGLPKLQALIELGYDPDDAATWTDAAQAQAELDAAMAVDAMGGRLSPVPLTPGGILPPPASPPAGAPEPAVP